MISCSPRSNVPTARLSERCCFCSSGSWSRCAVPSSTRPSRGIAPARKSTCSASVVLPAPAWPASTTLRMWARSWLFNVIARGTSRCNRRTGPGRDGTVGAGGAQSCDAGPLQDAGGALTRPGDEPDDPMIVGILPPDVRSFQMVHDQAPEGRQRLEAQRHVHEGRARDRGRRARRAAATRTPTTGSGSPSTRHARSTCPPTTSSGRSRRRPAAARRSSSRRSSTRATAPAAWRSSWRPRPTTGTARPPRCARSSPRPAASSRARARSRGSSRRAA